MKKRGGILTQRREGIFFKEEMHDVLHYDGGASVKATPSLHHDSNFTISSQECGCLISDFYDQLCGSQKSDELFGRTRW
jgi:hypothetical protein